MRESKPVLTSNWFSKSVLLATGGVVAIGTAWSFTRGGGDFRVFYHAWHLVTEGRFQEVYTNSPDRYLYSPGFAWLLSWIAVMPSAWALAVWNLAKAGVAGFVLRASGNISRVPTWPTWMTGALAILFLSRPVLIEFQYGQINLFLLGAALSALGTRLVNNPRFIALRWGVLAGFAATKLFLLPLLLVPFLAVRDMKREELSRERWGTLLGFSFLLLCPVLSEGFLGSLTLFQGWHGALISKGVPTESHNQSLMAFLMHYTSGEGTPILAMNFAAPVFGIAWLKPLWIQWIAISWAVLTLLTTVLWIAVGYSRIERGRWAAILIALLILPSHLIWKPYFVMGIPLAAILVHDCATEWQRSKKYWKWTLALVLFGFLNLTTFDLIGYDLAARFEGAALFLWVHLGLICLVWLGLVRK